MGLIDILAKSVLRTKKPADDPAETLQMLATSIGQTALGTFGGLVERFREGGLKREVDTWLASGFNLPVSREQLDRVLGADVIKQFVAATGKSRDDLLKALSAHLPAVIDQLSPNGKVEEPPPAAPAPPPKDTSAKPREG